MAFDFLTRGMFIFRAWDGLNCSCEFDLHTLRVSQIERTETTKDVRLMPTYSSLTRTLFDNFSKGSLKVTRLTVEPRLSSTSTPPGTMLGEPSN